MKKQKKIIEPVKSKFYKLNPSKPIAAEGYKSLLPWVLFAVALFFCAILAFIVIVNKDSDKYVASDYKIFFVLCGVFLGLSVCLLAAYLTRNAIVRKRILAADITYATVTSALISKHISRDKDGTKRTRENVNLVYEFFDKEGNKRVERLDKTYNRAPEFYEGQQLVVAFDKSKCYLLSKYSLIDDNGAQTEADSEIPAIHGFTDNTVNINVEDFVPLNYDKRYYILAAFYLIPTIIFASLIIFFAITVKDNYVWVFTAMTALPFVVCLILTVNAAIVPFAAKRRYDSIVSVGATYTRGNLESANKIYGNGAKTKYICKYVDSNGSERTLNLRKTFFVKKFVRQGHTDVIVAYASDKAIVLVKKPKIR